MAARLKAPDPQRVIRALAVLNATGRSLASFQDEAQAGLLEGFALERLVLNPDRDVLRQRIAQAILDHARSWGRRGGAGDCSLRSSIRSCRR